MRIVKQTITKAGKRRITVELDDDQKLIVVRDGAHYKLGYPVEDIMPAHVITEVVPVMWCAIEQKWIE